MDRIYLNVYQLLLQTGGGVAYFFKKHRGALVASTTLMAQMTRDFVKRIHLFAKDNGIEFERFKKGVRKDDVTKERLRHFQEPEGVVHIGVAQKSLHFSGGAENQRRDRDGVSVAGSLERDV